MYKDIVYEKTDLRYLKWTKTRKSSGTAGSFLKAYDDSGIVKKYYKLSDYDAIKGIVGHECINEIIVQRLMGILEIDHLEYRLINALVSIDDKEYETYLCESEDFKQRDESKMALEDFYVAEKKTGETPLEFCKRMGWEEYIYGMLVIDYIILNRDRHGANIEVLRNRKTKNLRIAPLFDQGLSFVCRCHNKKEIESFDVMKDQKVQAFIGSTSTTENLNLIPKKFLRTIPELKEEDIQMVTSGFDGVIDASYIEKIREMIRRRWVHIDSIRNKR